MAEYIDKTEVVNKLIRLENKYLFYKEKWDAEVLYRRICELEIGIRKTPAADVVKVVRCRDCRYKDTDECSMSYVSDYGKQYIWNNDDDFCSYGERRAD